MAAYIATIKFTQQGLTAIADSPSRAAAFKSAAQKMGVSVTGQYWTLGAFDGVIFFEAPNDEAATAAMLHLDALGNVQTTTARAFTAAEMQEILRLVSQ